MISHSCYNGVTRTENDSLKAKFAVFEDLSDTVGHTLMLEWRKHGVRIRLHLC
jgi:hypothetical protein